MQISLASFLSYWVASICPYWLAGEPTQMAALWAVISSVIVVQESLSETEEAVTIRFMGSLIGSIMALIFFVLLPIHAVSIACFVFVTAAFCTIVKFKKHMRLACITFVLLLLIHEISPSQPIWYFALWRLFDSVIGSVVAFLVVRGFLWCRI